MKKVLIQTAMLVMAILINVLTCSAQEREYDVFIPISKYIQNGDAERLSAWFADNLEITMFQQTNESSKNQAKQIIKTFFNSYTPRKFSIDHKAGRSNLKYAVGSLNAGGELFLVTIFVSNKNDSQAFQIQQLKFEKID